jgi:hypothetical protein
MTALGRLTAAASATLLVLAGCASAPPPDDGAPKPPAYPNWPETLAGFRFRWAAEPGVDLLTGPAVPLRAFLEAYRVGYFTPRSREERPRFVAYPGFFDAVAEPTGVGPQIPFQISEAWPFPGRPYPPRPEYGTEYLHVLQIDPIDGGYRAYVCDGRYNTFEKDRTSNRYVSALGPGSKNYFELVQIWRVELHTAGPTATNDGLQKGPNPAPIGDVFGNWKVTASDKGFWGMAGTPETREAAKVADEQHYRCLRSMPHSPADMVTMSRRQFDSPPPFEPAVPGWPAQAS